MVAMLIALLIICVVVGFTLWCVAAISRLVWRSSFVREMRGIGRRRRPDVELVGVTTTWCQGCDELVSDIRMTFTEGLYRCDACRGDRIESPAVAWVDPGDDDMVSVRTYQNLWPI